MDGWMDTHTLPRPQVHVDIPGCQVLLTTNKHALQSGKMSLQITSADMHLKITY